MAKDSEHYAQMNAGLDGNRKIMKAGRDGRDVFLWVLRQVALRGSFGRIPARDIEDTEWLAKVLMCSEEEVKSGIANALRVELLKLEDGECIAVGWTPAHGRRAQTGGERTAKWRAGKDEPSPGVTGDDAPSPRDEKTSQPVTDVTTSDDVTKSDTGRKEGRKEGQPRHDRDGKAKKHLLPDDWGPSDRLHAVAREEGVSLKRELGKMRSWAKSNGHKKLDWTATFDGWLKRAGETRRKDKRPPEVDPPPNGALFNARASPDRADEPPVKFFTSDDEDDPCPDS